MLVDIGPDGRNGDPRFIPIEPTALVEIRIRDANVTTEQLEAEAPDPATKLVKVIVEPAATADASGAVARAIREALPFVTGVSWQSPELDHSAAARTIELKEPSAKRSFTTCASS